MISDAPIVTAVVDDAKRSTFAWTGWYTQLSAALNAFIGAFTVGKNNAITITNPAGLQFGPGWQNWIPAHSAGGAMTITAFSVGYAAWIQKGPDIDFQLNVSLTTGGTPSNLLQLSIPAAQSPVATVAASGYVFTSAWQPAFCYVRGSIVFIEQAGEANFPIGNISLIVSGKVRVV